MNVRDLPAVHRLLEQLGYDVRPDDVAHRFAAVAGTDGHALFVAESGGRVVGFLHVFARPALEKPAEGIVKAMAVDTARRRGGIGRTLMSCAEDWAVERGFRSLALASEIDREDSHAFYRRLGYEPTATSRLFRKKLDS